MLRFMLSFISSIFRPRKSRFLSSVERLVDSALEFNVSHLSDSEIIAKTNEFKIKLKNKTTTLDSILPYSFALVREVSRRVLGMEHFRVQLMGGVCLHKGMIVEMKTGEGKTLTVTLPAYLNALNGKGVHVVTVNDYLARRDSEWMGQIYKALGVTVGCITSETPMRDRKSQYACDITYITNNELGFDYLRHNQRFDDKSESTIPELSECFICIDEADSTCIDESRTPLILSGAAREDLKFYKKIDKMISNLVNEDIEIDEKSSSVSLTDFGIEKIEKMLKQEGLISEESLLYDMDNVQLVGSVDQALKAHKLFKVDDQYIIKDGKVIIIDEFTGRPMEGRRFSDGLHQALEAKENVRINQENQTIASITFQNLFRSYGKLSGMTGTAITEAREFKSTYGLDVISIPTNLPIARIDEDDEIYATNEEKLEAIINLIEECHSKLQPVLVGTTSIAKSEVLSSLLTKHGLKHRVLNAKYHLEEAQIIAQAGRSGSITIATNMAGRGTDIKLGGNFSMMSGQDKNLTKEHVDKDADLVREKGGLYVIGTEKHESRRIDNQLRGRSGRQGDPGKSKFFLSLDDDLLRIFGSTKIRSILKTLGLKKGESINHPWITRALEKAQSKVEYQNYEMRKTLLKFDDVINEQRKFIFAKRDCIISEESTVDSLFVHARNLNNRLINRLSSKDGVVNVEGLRVEVLRIYGLNFEHSFGSKDKALADLNKKVEELFLNKDKLCEGPIMSAVKKRIMLMSLDFLWKEHLNSLDYLRRSVSLRSVAQKNPINEFKREGFELFEQMIQNWEEMIVSRFIRISIETQDDQNTTKKEEIV